MAFERNKPILEDLLWKAGNAQCADCGGPDSKWASCNLGVFICLNCSGIHRNIPQVSKVKSTHLDYWDDAQVEFMASHGNNEAKAKYESKLPPFYYRPTFMDCQGSRGIKAYDKRAEIKRCNKPVERTRLDGLNGLLLFQFSFHPTLLPNLWLGLETRNLAKARLCQCTK